MQSAVARYISELNDQGNLRGVDIANITDVSPATVSRWTTGTHKPQPNTQLILSDLHYIVGRLQEYYSREEIRLWLYAPHPQLEGRRAIDLIVQNKSDQVIAVLDRLDADVYV